MFDISDLIRFFNRSCLLSRSYYMQMITPHTVRYTQRGDEAQCSVL